MLNFDKEGSSVRKNMKNMYGCVGCDEKDEGTELTLLTAYDLVSTCMHGFRMKI